MPSLALGNAGRRSTTLGLHRAFALILASAAGCATVQFKHEAPEVILRVPHTTLFKLAASPDGSLFAGGGGVVFRASLTNTTQWTPISFLGQLVIGLYAPSAQHVYAITRECGKIFEWDSGSGWRTAFDAPRDSSRGQCYGMHAIEGSNARDIYAVGSNGLVVHYDGTHWLRDTQIVQLLESSRRVGHVYEAVTRQSENCSVRN